MKLWQLVGFTCLATVFSVPGFLHAQDDEAGTQSGASDSPMRIINLDSGEIQITGDFVMELPRAGSFDGENIFVGREGNFAINGELRLQQDHIVVNAKRGSMSVGDAVTLQATSAVISPRAP